MTTNSFLPEGYEKELSVGGGNYFKIKDGESKKIRFLSNSISGYEYFKSTPEGGSKPVRQKNPFDGIPADSKDGRKPSYFWAFVIYNYDEERVQIWEITRSDIKNTLIALYNDPDFGDPKGYDLKISRTGKGQQDTSYTVIPLNKTVFENSEVLKQAGSVRLEALYDGENPFNPF